MGRVKIAPENKKLLNIKGRTVIGQKIRIKNKGGINPLNKKRLSKLKKLLKKRLKKEQKEYIRRVGEEEAKNWKIQIQSYFENLEWRGGYSFDMAGDVDEEFNLHDHTKEYYNEETGNITDIFITYYNVNREGKTDKYNDCLYHAINKGLNFSITKKPWNLKKYLKIDRHAGIDIRYMPMVEKYFKVNINVRGDHIFISNNKHSKTINIKLLNGHYSFDYDIKRSLEQHYFKSQRAKTNLIIYRVDKQNQKIYIYDGVKEQEITRDKYLEMRNAKIYDVDYVLTSRLNIKEDLKTNYDNYLKLSRDLYRLSEGRINLMCFKTTNDLIYYLLDMYNKTIDPEEIDQLEAEWLDKCFRGGLIKHKLYNGPAFQYDYTSYYPSIMSSKKTFPIKKGEFVEVSMDEITKQGFFNYGIYKAIIKNENEDKTKNILFKFNKFNLYTHLDMKTAQDLGFTIKLYDGINALLYTGNEVKAKGFTMFNDLIDFLFMLKTEAPNKEVKQYVNKLLQMTWGALCAKKTIQKMADTDKNEYVDITNKNINLDAVYETNNILFVRYTENEKHFKTNYARMAPFMTSFGRRGMYDLLKDNIEDIQHIHTDGVIVNKKLNTKLNPGLLGGLKLEKQGTVNIENQHNYKWC